MAERKSATRVQGVRWAPAAESWRATGPGTRSDPVDRQKPTALRARGPDRRDRRSARTRTALGRSAALAFALRAAAGFWSESVSSLEAALASRKKNSSRPKKATLIEPHLAAVCQSHTLLRIQALDAEKPLPL